MKIVDNLDLTQNQLLNAVTQNLASAPSSPVIGQRFYNTTLNTEQVWNGSSWATLDAAKATILASNISNFAAAADALTLDSFTAPVANVSMNSNKITNLATPTVSTDAATKGYIDTTVQSSAAGIVSKQAVAVVAVANITLSGTQTVDGIALSVGNRVLCVAQTSNTSNGVYIVASGAWTRSTNDANGELDLGATFFVEQGTVYGSSTFRLATPVSGSIIPGTTAVTFTQLTAAATYTASLGVVLTGNNIQAAYGNGLGLSGNNLIVNSAVIPSKYAVTIGDGSTTSYTITHNLNTLDVQVTTYLISTGEQVLANNLRTSVNAISVQFAIAPSSNSYRCIVFG